MQFQLTVTSGPDKDTTRDLNQGDLILIGRGATADLRLSDPAISRMHCRIFVDGETITIRDAGSSSGTFVSGNSIELTSLRAGDTIRIGHTELTLEVHSSPRKVPPLPRSSSHPSQAQPSPSPMMDHPDALIGSRIDGLEVRHLVARGRSGQVFEAKDTRAGQRVALKLFYAANSELLEHRLASSVALFRNRQHPNLVGVFQAGRYRDRPYLVMEYADGRTAAELTRAKGVGGMLSWREVLRIVTQVAHALEFLDDLGVVHRNISPRTIFVTEETTKLANTTHARPISVYADPAEEGGPTGESLYQAPEFNQRPQGDTRTDIFSLGAVAYAMLAGQVPTVSVNTTPTLPSELQIGIPPLLESVVMTMLQWEPERRFQSAGELTTALERVKKYTGK